MARGGGRSPARRSRDQAAPGELLATADRSAQAANTGRRTRRAAGPGHARARADRRHDARGGANGPEAGSTRVPCSPVVLGQSAKTPSDAPATDGTLAAAFLWDREESLRGMDRGIMCATGGHGRGSRSVEGRHREVGSVSGRRWDREPSHHNGEGLGIDELQRSCNPRAPFWPGTFYSYGPTTGHGKHHDARGPHRKTFLQAYRTSRRPARVCAWGVRCVQWLIRISRTTSAGRTTTGTRSRRATRTAKMEDAARILGTRTDTEGGGFIRSEGPRGESAEVFLKRRIVREAFGDRGAMAADHGARARQWTQGGIARALGSSEGGGGGDPKV